MYIVYCFPNIITGINDKFLFSADGITYYSVQFFTRNLHNQCITTRNKPMDTRIFTDKGFDVRFLVAWVKGSSWVFMGDMVQRVIRGF